MPKVRDAPASSVAKTSGCPSVGTLGTILNPASRRRPIMRSQPSVMPRFFSGNRRLSDPVLQSVHRFVVTLLDLHLNGLQIKRVRSPALAVKRPTSRRPQSYCYRKTFTQNSGYPQTPTRGALELSNARISILAPGLG